MSVLLAELLGLVVLVGEGHGDVLGGGALLVSDGLVFSFDWDDDDSITSECCFRTEEDDAEQQDTEEDGADAERPAIAGVLDDVTGDESTAGNTSQEEKIPYCDAGSSFVDEVQIADCALDKHLIWRHADT